MEALNILFKFFFIHTVITSCFVSAEDTCATKTPCSCEFPNGTGIDLTPSVKSTFYKAAVFVEKTSSLELNTYYFHPCFDASSTELNSTKPGDTCGQSLSICRFIKTMNVTDPKNPSSFQANAGVYNFMGSVNHTVFQTDGRSIIYTNGPSATVVMLICAQTDDQLYIYSLEEPDNIVLQFYSRHACLKLMEEIGRSFGSTLLIIFFSFVIFYLVLGVCTKKFLMGATGVEVIPNLGFWTDLPNLVKDGWAFTINGFKLPARTPGPTTSPDPNSYDSI